MSWRASLVAVAIAAAVGPTVLLAQNGGNGNDNGGRRQGGGNNGGNGGGGGGGGSGGNNNNNGGGGGGRGDPAQWQQRMMDQIKEQSGASDEEWKVIEPKLTKVMEAQRNVRAGGMGFGGFGGRRGPGGGGGGGDQAPTTKIGIAASDLRKAVQSDAASPEDIDKKLTAYRAARTEAQAQLESARKDLKDLLTAKQEAALVLTGMLE